MPRKYSCRPFYLLLTYSLKTKILWKGGRVLSASWPHSNKLKLSGLPKFLSPCLSSHLTTYNISGGGGRANCRQSAHIPHPWLLHVTWLPVAYFYPWAACTCRSAHLTHLHRKRREGGTVLFWKMQWRQCFNNWNTAVYSKTCQRLRHKYILVGFSRNLTKYWFREIKYFSYLNNDCF